jgi:3',5'-nucleoside bisphosphate phosphatase
LRPFLADLHIHTVLSPCAEVEMIPPFIVAQARDLGLGIIAVTDHNSAENAGAVMEAARGMDLTVLPGMEVQSREEVHLVCLFGDLSDALAWQELVYERLPPLKNNEEVFGGQFVVDATGEFIRRNDRLLLASTGMSVEEIALGVAERHGLCIPAHIDRPSYGLLANLGFVPEGSSFAALEVSKHGNIDELRGRHPSVGRWNCITSGDAHRLEEMSDRTILTVAEPTIDEIKLALLGQQGRRVKVLADKPIS